VPALKITVLGSGDTRGLPKVGCACATCADALRTGFERKRFGLLVEHYDETTGRRTRLLVDASPDLRRVCLQHGFSSKDLDAVLITHEHYDHVAGLGDFFYDGRTIPLYARPDCIDHVFSEHAYGYLRGFRLFDFQRTAFFQPFSVGSITVTPVPVHHSIETQGFIFAAGGKKAAVLTDCRASVPDETLDAIRGVDVLFTDGWLENAEQFVEAYRAFHPGLSDSELAELLKDKKRNHLLISEARDLATRVGARKTVLLHVAHAARPHRVLAQEYDSETLTIGYDGLHVSF